MNKEEAWHEFQAMVHAGEDGPTYTTEEVNAYIEELGLLEDTPTDET